MRVCQRCGAETDEPRCPACGYTSFIDLAAATERPTPPSEPAPEPTPVGVAEEALPPHLRLARRRGWWALGLLLPAPVCTGLGALLTRLVPETAAGCGPLFFSGLALVLATIGYLGKLPLLVAAVVMGILAVSAWRRPAEAE